MELTLHAKDGAVAMLALLGALLSSAMVVRMLGQVLGRRLAQVEESIAAWLLVDAAGWRARDARKAELERHQPVLAPAQAEVEAA